MLGRDPDLVHRGGVDRRRRSPPCPARIASASPRSPLTSSQPSVAVSFAAFSRAADEADDLVAAVAQLAHDLAADEAGAARDEDLHGAKPIQDRSLQSGSSGSIAKRPKQRRRSTARTAPASANPRARQRALAIGIVDGREEGDPLAELKELLRTAGVATAGEMVQRRAQPDPDRYFGRGKLAELKAADRRRGANLVACDDELAPRQERNLEAALGVPVIDRTAVILDIFADHAHSAEGKLQVELAQLEYNMARMRGLWTHLERLGGGIGTAARTRGPGETQIETDRRLARDRIAALRRRLTRLERNRGVMRARRERSSLPRGRPRRLHQRRQVDAAERADRRRGRGRGPPLPHPRPDDPQLRALRPRLPAHRHRRLHREAARTSWSRRSRRRSRRPCSPT